AARLRSAPAAATLPRFPTFRRVVRTATIEGWTALETGRLSYRIVLRDLLRRATVPADVTLDMSPPDEAAGIAAPVPDLERLVVRVPRARSREGLRLRALRLGVWLTVLASVGC